MVMVRERDGGTYYCSSGRALAVAGHEVVCIARGANLAAMREKGLTLKMGGEARTASELHWRITVDNRTSG